MRFRRERRRGSVRSRTGVAVWSIMQAAEEKSAGLRGSMGTTQVALTVLAMAAPLSNVYGVLPLGITRGNGIGTPAIYIFVGAIFLLFAVGFTTMARNLPRAGAFYTYVTAGLGRPIGLGSAYLTTFAYFVFCIGSYAYFGYAFGDTLTRVAGIEGVPWWVWSAASLIAVGALGVCNVEVSGKVLVALMAIEIGLVMLFNLPVLFTGGPEGYQGDSFMPTGIFSGDLGVAVLFAIACYIGFETTVIYRDEVKDARRTIPRAMYIAIAGLCAFYVVSAWCLVTFWGTGNVAEIGRDSESVLFTGGFEYYMGATFTQILTVLVVTSVFAGALSTHNAFTRYLFMLGRDGSLPSYLSRATERYASPGKASVTASALSAIVLMPFVLTGVGANKLYPSMFGFGTFSLVVMFVLVSISTLRYFRLVRHREAAWNTTVAPILSTLGMGLLLVISSVYFSMSIEAPLPVAVAEQVLLLAILAVGTCIGLYLRRNRPEAYRRIGNAAGDHHDVRLRTGKPPVVTRQ